MTSVFGFEARLVENSILRFYVNNNWMVECTATETQTVCNVHCAKLCLVTQLCLQKSNETVPVTKSYVELKFCSW